MFRKALVAIAALGLAIQPALAQDDHQRPAHGENMNPIGKETLLPLGIIVAMVAAVILLTLHTRHNDKPTSP